MRHHVSHFFTLLMLQAVLYSCTKDNFAIGKSIQPSKDTVWTDASFYALKSKTVLVDSILQRNENAILGAYTDNIFGTTKSDFVTQLYCPESFSFGENVIDNKIDSAYIYLFFDDYYGDSLSLFEASVYLLEKPLDLNRLYYTNIKISDYCSGKEIGKGTFTVNSSDNSWNDNYEKCIRIPVDRTFAQQLYNDSKSHPEYFKDLESFTNYFKGIYVTTNYGNGAFVYINDIELEIIYQYRYTETDSLGVQTTKDTTAASYFLYTKEVRQVNTYNHLDLDKYISAEDVENDSLNYLYAPAGMYTSLAIPLEKVYNQLPGTNINYARIKMTATSVYDALWTMDPPEQLLLVEEKSLNSFFANYSLQDKYSTFTASYSESDTCFVFDVSPLIQRYIRKWDADQSLIESDPDTVLEMLVVPVETVTNGDNTSLYLLPTTDPSAVKIRSASHPTRPMKLEVVASSRK